VKVLGLDIATTTGYACIDDDLIILKTGLIKLDSESSVRVKLKDFRWHLLELIEELKPDRIVLEGVYLGPNPKNTAFLNNLRGVAIETIPMEAKFLSVYTSTVRKCFLSSGKASKQEAFEWAKQKYSLHDFEFKSHNDITDAILLAEYGLINES
jgi:Holliday junction resolvasome RuvABC endonuclease subunit